MIQDLITFILIAVSVAYTVFSLYRMIFPVRKNPIHQCMGCTGCQTGNNVKIIKTHT